MGTVRDPLVWSVSRYWMHPSLNERQSGRSGPFGSPDAANWPQLHRVAVLLAGIRDTKNRFVAGVLPSQELALPDRKHLRARDLR